MAKNSKAISEETPPEASYGVTLRTDTGYEYHLELSESVIEDILNPATPARFIAVPPLASGGRPLQGTARLLSTAYIKEMDIRGWGNG